MFDTNRHRSAPTMTATTRQSLTLCAAIMAILIWLPVVVRAESVDTAVVFTADTEGAVFPCRSCDGSIGGLARRATSLLEMRAADPGVVLLDAGNALFGTDSVGSQGRVIVAAYDTLAYDAVNLSYRDFRYGKSATLALLKDASFAFVSANVVEARSGRLLAKPFVVMRKAGADPVAVLGLTQIPVAMANLPHMKTQLAGIVIRPAVEALAEWLPKARAEAARVIVLFYGSSQILGQIERRFGSQLEAILVGGLEPEELPTSAHPMIVGATQHGAALTQIRWVSGRIDVSRIGIDSTFGPDPGMEALVKRFMPAVGSSKDMEPR